MQDLAYHYGVFLGDGYIERYHPSTGTGAYVMLKVCDRELVEHWRDVLYRVTGTYYKIQVEPSRHKNRRHRYKCKTGKRSFVKRTIEETGGAESGSRKSKIPQFILDGTSEIKKAFLQGLMDSEAWISCVMKPMGISHINLAVANTDPWFFDVHRLFKDLGIETTKVHKKVGKQGKKDLFWISINVLDYVNAGMGFNIKRKQDRLDYCVDILTGHTRNYPKYDDYYEESDFGQEDMVGHASKVA